MADLGQGELSSDIGIVRSFDPDSKAVELHGVAPGINLHVTRDWTGVENKYQFDIDATPELPNTTMATYEDQGSAVYNGSGILEAVRTHRFFGANPDQEAGAMFDSLDWSQGGMFVSAVRSGQLVSEKFSPEAGKSVMEALAEAEMQYQKDIEEPNIHFRQGEGGVWSVSLLPSDETTMIPEGEGDITEVQDLGGIVQDTEQTMRVRWRGNRLNYAVQTGVVGGVPVNHFITFMDQPVMNVEGIDAARFTRTMTVPQRVDKGNLNGLFDQKKATYQSMRTWFPVNVQKPL